MLINVLKLKLRYSNQFWNASMPKKQRCQSLAESCHNSHFLPHFNSKASGPIFTNFLHYVEALVELLMQHVQGDTAFYLKTPEQRVKVVNFDVCKKPKKLISSYSNILWAITNLCQFYNPHTYIYQCWKFGNDLSLVIAEIFGGICWFWRYPKRCICYPHNLWSYWYDLRQSMHLRQFDCERQTDRHTDGHTRQHIGYHTSIAIKTRSTAMAEGLREALVSRNPATTKHITWKPYRVALFAWFYV